MQGRLTKLIEISEKDASFICKLRNEPSINRYLSSTNKTNIEEQKKWIKENLLKKDGVYFKIIDIPNEKEVGTISLYNKIKDEAEFGRFICESSIQAIEAEYLIIKYGFENYLLNRIYCRTLEQNKIVWMQHYKFGFKDAGIQFVNNNFILRVQEIYKNEFISFDYEKILTIIDRFGNRK